MDIFMKYHPKKMISNKIRNKNKLTGQKDIPNFD